MLGIDVSKWQRDMDWLAMREAGVEFAFAKATESTHGVDRYFARNWPAMKDAGIVRGAYHFFRPAQDPVLQAAHFVATVGRLEPGDLPLALDVEATGDLQPAELAQSILTCLQEIERLTGVRPIFYTSPGFWNYCVALSVVPAWAGTYPLWLANYTIAPKPRIPWGWNSWCIWQFTQYGHIDGHEGNLDLNRLNGSLDDLRIPTTDSEKV